MAQTLKFDDAAARSLQTVYMTADVVSQREQTLAVLAMHPGEKVIDIGTGPGYLAASMARAVGADGRVVGVDASESMLAVARASCADFPWVEFHTGDAAVLPAADGAFDAAVSTQVYEYLPDVNRAFSEANRVLRPGGRIVIVDTDWDSIVWATSDEALTARLLGVFDEHLVDPHLPRTLAERLRGAGFEVDLVAAIPIVNTVFDDTVFSHGISKLIADFVTGRQGVTESDVANWLDDLRTRNREGRYFFSLNRYLFAAHKP